MFSFLQRLRLLKHILTIREHPYMMEDDDYATWLEKPAYRMRIDSVLTTDEAWRRPAGQVGAKLKILYILGGRACSWPCQLIRQRADDDYSACAACDVFGSPPIS